jgi:SAM-dependent methyltransferase
VVPRDDPQWEIWRRRTESYRVLLSKVVTPIGAASGSGLRVLDLGAGNCWLSHRLAQLGHHAAAIDISTDATDGLGAHVWYRSSHTRPPCGSITPILAEFDRLPLRDGAADLAIFDASLHYSTNLGATVGEALRVLSPSGRLVMLDSPVYLNSECGEQMVREHEDELEKRYGFRSDSLPAKHFFTWSGLADLERDQSLSWRVYRLAGPITRARAHWRRLRGRRELAELPIIVGRRV